jgi:hypothetical protein
MVLLLLLGFLAAILVDVPLPTISLAQNVRRLRDERRSFLTDFGLLVAGRATCHVLSHNSGASPEAFRLGRTFDLIANTQHELRRNIHHSRRA